MIATASAWLRGRNATGNRSCSSRPSDVERELRARDVGDEQVEQARGEVHPRRLREHRRRREVLHAGQHLGADRLLGLLQPVHRLADDLQPRDRVLDVDRQRPAHDGEPVAHVAVLVGARGSRPARARAARAPRCARRASCSQRRSAPATTVSTTSLTVPPNASLIALKSDSSQRTSSSRRCGPIGTLSGVSGAGFRPGPRDLGHALDRLARGVQRRCRPRRGAERAAGERRTAARTSPRTPRAASEAALGSGWGAHGSPSCGSGRRHRLEVEQHGREVDAGDAVDERVVRLGDQREAAVVEPLDEPQLPQRLRAVELLRVDARGQRAQLLLAAGARERGVAQVVLEVEARVVDPQRPAGLERRHRELLPVARDEVQPAADVVGEVREGRRRALEDHHGADVHVRVRPFLGEEGRVHRGEPIAVRLRHVFSLPNRSRESVVAQTQRCREACDHRGEQRHGEDLLVAARCAPGAANSGRPARCPATTTGTRIATSVASGTAPCVPVADSAITPTTLSPRKHHGHRVAQLRGLERAAQQVDDQRRAGGRRRGGQRRRRRSRRRHRHQLGSVAARGESARARASPSTPTLTAIWSATASSARSTATPATAPGSAQARMTAHSRATGRGRRRSVEQRQHVDERAEHDHQPDRLLGLDRGEHERGGDHARSRTRWRTAAPRRPPPPRPPSAASEDAVVAVCAEPGRLPRHHPCHQVIAARLAVDRAGEVELALDRPDLLVAVGRQDLRRSPTATQPIGTIAPSGDRRVHVHDAVDADLGPAPTARRGTALHRVAMNASRTICAPLTCACGPISTSSPTTTGWRRARARARAPSPRSARRPPRCRPRRVTTAFQSTRASLSDRGRRRTAPRSARPRRSGERSASPPCARPASIQGRAAIIPAMAWDFSTEPEFQEQLDWMRAFVRDEIWPIETVFDELGQDGFERAMAPLKERVRERGLWAAHLPPDLGGQGFGQVKLGLMHEILGVEPVRAGGVRQPGAGLGQLGGARARRHRRPEGAVAAPAAGGRPALGVLDDRAGHRRAATRRCSRRARSRTATAGSSTAASGSPPTHRSPTS